MRESYKQAGVDVEAGYKAVEGMKKHIERTKRPEVMGEIGRFGGMFDLSFLTYDEPVLVSGTDGVGTKLKIAFDTHRHDTIGIDAVAMCVNDIIAQGADPLFFLDYISCGKNDPKQIEEIVKGISEGCVQSGCALIGGETAEMPGMYPEGEYDLAGFVVGIAEKQNMITGDDIEPGDVLIGIASSGIHSNGYSLVRKVIHDKGMDLNQDYGMFDHSLAEVLLTPTKIYADAIKALKKEVYVKGISHITGGGFDENIPRMLPSSYGALIEKGAWEVPSVFSFLQQAGELNELDMYSVFNMGIGMVVAVSPDDVEDALKELHTSGEKAWSIGQVTYSSGVRYR